jgi:hypothetical protein
LVFKNGISQEVMTIYCQQLEKSFSEDQKLVYISINKREIENTLLKYHKEFRYFRGEYFLNKEELNINYFNSRYPEEVRSRLVNEAVNVTQRAV